MMALGIGAGCGKPKTPPTQDEIKQFFRAACSDDTTTMDQLLKTRSNPDLLNAIGHKGRTPLHEAAGRGKIEAVKLLIARGASIEATDEDKGTPLHTAAANGQAVAVDLLLAKGAKVDSVDNTGATPLAYAAYLGRAQAAEALLKKGADPNSRSEGTTPLAKALAQGHQDVADVIRKHGGTN